MEIIVPCAGLSSRFPNMRPKFLLTTYDGKFMFEKSIEPFVKDNNITIIILKEHNEMYDIESIIKNNIDYDINIVVLDNPTSGPADTVYRGILKSNFKKDSPFLIKDCDSFFRIDNINEIQNIVYTSSLCSNLELQNVASKSFIICNNQNIVNSIIEKKVVSELFCAGGYQFSSIQEYIKNFEQLKKGSTSEIFVSDVISYMISKGKIFSQKLVDNYQDVGTLVEWLKYNNKPTYFSDIDGVLVNTIMNDYTRYTPITENIDVLLEKMENGSQIVFCTARPEKLKEFTYDMLSSFGFKNFTLIMGLNHSKRVLINDFAATNPYPSAISVNLTRNNKNLRDYV